MKKNYLFIAFIALVIGLSFGSCSKDDNNGGSNNGKTDPSTIATANLIAYWGFENTPKDAIGQRGTATSAVKYVTGRRGQAFQGADNAYISFDLPATDRLATLKEFTVAMWIKAPKIPAGKGIPCFFQLSGNGWEGALGVWQDNVDDNSADSIKLAGQFGKKGVPWQGQWWNKSNPSMTADKWIHFAINYSSATSTATLYVNGGAFKYITTSAYDLTTRFQSDPGDANNINGAQKLGDLLLPLRDSNNKGIIGYWALKAFYGGADDWQGFYSGMMDELRVYDKALSDQEVKALYDAEVTQVN